MHRWTEDTLWEVMYVGGGPWKVLDEQLGVGSFKDMGSSSHSIPFKPTGWHAEGAGNINETCGSLNR